MRHQKHRSKLGRQPAHRIQTVKAIAAHLLVHARIKTTIAKAKAARRLAERLITIAKDNTVNARRMAYAYLNDRRAVKRLFADIAPLFKERKSGFTRIIPLNFRRGDGANIVFLELTERKPEEIKLKKGKKAEEKIEKKPGPRPEPKRAETKGLEKPLAQREKEAPETRSAPKVEKEAVEERAVEEVKKEKAKEEERRYQKEKGLFKNIKGFFRRRTHM